MRSLLLLIPAALLSLCLRAQEKPLVIRGTISGADGKTLTLLNVDNNKKADAYIVRNNSFVLKGRAGGLTVFALTLKGADFPLLLAGEGGDTIRVKAAGDDFPLSDVQGNGQSMTMQQYQREFSPLMREAKEINRRAAATNENDSAAMASLQQRADAFNSRMKRTGTAFIQYHPDAVASVFVLMNEVHTMAPQQLVHLFNSLSDKVKNSRYGKMAAMQINMMAATAIGAPAPVFTLDDVNGQPVSLSSFRGKYVLVDFWASWCGPCRAENPNVVKAYDQFRDKNFTILGVSLDKSQDSWVNAIRQDGLSWTQVSDLKGWNNAAAQLYHVYSIPTNFLIGPDGKIIAKNLRGGALEQKLAEVLH